MTLSVEQLITQVTKDQALQTVLDLLASHGYPVSSWQSGSVQRTIFEVVAQCLSDLRKAAVGIARGGINALSSDDWLTVFSDSQYDNQRFEGIKTRGMVAITDATRTGPHTIEVDEIVVTDQINGYRYRNITAGTLSLGATLSLLFEAEAIGTARDVANGTITVLSQGPTGATVNNPAVSEGTWITRKGADVESDAALRARNTDKWGTLSIGGGPSAAYRYWARMANATVRRVEVDDQNPAGPGTLSVFIAGDDGALPSSVVTEVQAYIDGDDGVGRRPLGAIPTVYSVTEHSVTFSGTLYMLRGLEADTVTQAAVLDAINTYFSSVPIGGVKTGGTGKFLLGGLLNAIFSVHGVVNAALTITGDVTLTTGQVAVPVVSPALTFVAAA